MQVTVPAGVGPGMPFQVNTAAGAMQVICPPDTSAGMPMLVNVPSVAPQPMAMAQAQPMTALPAQPVVVQGIVLPAEGGQPMSASTGVPAGNRLLLKLNVDLGGGCEDNTPPRSPPPELSMISSNDWTVVREGIEAYRKSSGFYACPCVEVACCLTCCCIVCCPVFVAVGKYDSRKKALEEKTIPDLNALLRKYGIRCEFKQPAMGEFLEFYGP